jgi:hypothetical protein
METANSAVWKNTDWVPKTLFALKGESLDVLARGTAGCSESDLLDVAACSDTP